MLTTALLAETFEPSAERGQLLDRRMRERLADSLSYVFAEVGEALGVEVKVVPIGHGDYTDDEGTWPALRGVQDGGAVLVRPDQFVAMRSAELPADPAAALEEGLRQLLSPTS